MAVRIPLDDAPYNAGAELAEAAARRGRENLFHCGRGETVSGERVAAHALALQAELERRGLRPGDRVLLQLRDTPAFVSAFVGALRGGFHPVPISTLLPERDLAFIVRDSAIGAAVVDGSANAAMPELVASARVVRSEDDTSIAGVETDAEPAAATTRADEDAFTLYTSGTTGDPKGVPHRQLDLAVTAECYARGVLGLDARDRVLSAAKLYFAYGLGNSLSFPLLLGCEACLLAERATPEAVFARLASDEPTVFFGVPTLYAALLAHPELPRSAGRLRLCVSAGEALPAALAERWCERFGVPILDGLGSTEMLHVFVSNRPDEQRPGSSGKPVPGYEVRLVDGDGRDVPAGEIGALHAGGRSAARRYHARPEESARVMFAPGWLRTGDSYRRDADGFYWHCGRSDDLMKVSGQYVSPVEVEAALATHPAVVEAAVVARSDADGLTKPHAFVVLTAGVAPGAELARALQELVKAKCAPHKYPRRVHFVAELPKTATGKIRRHLLREQAT